jgi:hypothetical protein
VQKLSRLILSLVFTLAIMASLVLTVSADGIGPH